MGFRPSKEELKDILEEIDEGSILQNSISAGSFSDKFSS
jgi:hypothetical protein